MGFVMVSQDVEARQYYLWRFVIAGEHQGNGYGKRALELVVEHVHGLPGASELLSSFVPGEHGPRGFYLAYGFVETGEVEGDEHVIGLVL